MQGEDRKVGREKQVASPLCNYDFHSLPQDMVLDAEALYERECYERTYHALRWKEAGTEKAIACGKSRIVEIDVFGKKGCTGGTIEIEYGARALSDGIAHAEGAPTAAPFYVRRLVISLNVTVHRVLLPIYMDVLPFWFSDEMSKDADAKRRLSVEEMVLDTPQLNGTAEDPLDDGSDYCLFTVDIRNSWNYPFDVSFLLRAPASIASVSSDPRDLPPTTDGDNALTATAPTTINPAQTKRIAIPIPKLQLESFLKELAMESRSATTAAHHFVFPTGPTNLVPDVPAVPVIKDRQFVLPQDGVAKNFAIIQSKVKKMRKERRSKRNAAQRKYGPAQYWLAGGESADANKAPTAEKEVDRHCWWYRDSSDDEEEERLQEDLNAAQTQLLGQAASEAPSFRLKEYRAAMEQAVDNERWSRLMFLYRDQLFRRCVAGIRWSCDENVYSEAKVAGTRRSVCGVGG